MISVEIDSTQLIEPFTNDLQRIRNISQAVVNGVSWALYNEIRNNASNGLRSTRNMFLRNINQPIIGPLKGTIVLTGSLPNMIEQGASAYDMKEGFLKSKKVKYTKTGKPYLTIPFRWATSGSLGENEAFSGVMPKEIEVMVKELRTARTTATFLTGGTTKRTGEGLKIPKSSPFGKVMTRGAFSSRETKQTFGSYTHKSPLMSGIVRQQKFYDKAIQGTYYSFRRVSLNSSANSWIHPGFTARDFFTKSLQSLDIETIQGNIISEELDNLGL